MQTKIYKIFPFVLLLSILSNADVQAQWVELPSTITASFGNCSVAHQGKIYFTGGPQTQFVTNTTYNTKLEILDLATNSVSMANGGLSVGRMAISAIAHEGKLYFAGGYKYVNTAAFIQVFNVVDVYDILSGTWSTKNLSVARGEVSAAVVDGKIMFAGGVTVSNNQRVVLSVIDVYDPANNTWTSDNLSQARSDCKAGVIDKKVWFCSGTTNWDAYIHTTKVDVYDSNTGLWTTDEVSLGREGGRVATVGKYLLLAGGFNQSSGTIGKTDRVDILNTETNIWTQATLSSPRAGLTSATLGNKVYFIGGGNYNISTNFLNTSTNIVDIFNADNGTWTAGTLNKNRTQHACAAWGNKIAVGGGWWAEQSQTTGSVEVFTDPTILAADEANTVDWAFEVFPNPAENYLNIKYSNDLLAEKAESITIFDVNGKLIHFYPKDEILKSNLDINGIIPGVYFLMIRADIGFSISRRFVVMR